MPLPEKTGTVASVDDAAFRTLCEQVEAGNWRVLGSWQLSVTQTPSPWGDPGRTVAVFHLTSSCEHWDPATVGDYPYGGKGEIGSRLQHRCNSAECSAAMAELGARKTAAQRTYHLITGARHILARLDSGELDEPGDAQRCVQLNREAAAAAGSAQAAERLAAAQWEGLRGRLEPYAVDAARRAAAKILARWECRNRSLHPREEQQIAERWLALDAPSMPWHSAVSSGPWGQFLWSGGFKQIPFVVARSSSLAGYGWGLAPSRAEGGWASVCAHLLAEWTGPLWVADAEALVGAARAAVTEIP